VAVVISAPFRMGILERSLTVATHFTSSCALQPPCILSYGDSVQLPGNRLHQHDRT
jgi:hypothetical protein